MGVRGYVQLVEGGKIIYEGNNLVTLTGRTFFQHKATDTGQYTSYRLTHFAIGDGGVDPNNPLIPIPPVESDTTLYSPIVIQPESTLKPITSLTHLSPTQTLIELNLGLTDGPPQFFYNEAGLFATYQDNVILVARITFPSVLKDHTREQVWYWWLFF